MKINYSFITRSSKEIKKDYQIYREKSENWIKKFQANGGKITCCTGCFFCCNMPIRINLIEALFLVNNISEKQFKLIQEHAKKVIKNAYKSKNEEEYITNHRLKVGFCPLLDPKTKSCTAYEYRPTRCRDTFSCMDIKYCQQEFWQKAKKENINNYRKEIKRTKGAYNSHFIDDLESLSEFIWQKASKIMPINVWGDFWTLCCLAKDGLFLEHILNKDKQNAIKRAKELKLWHSIVLEIY